MRVMVAMSGGVDSSVAAALVQRAGHHTVGVTLKLWDGSGDSGCCSVADVDDARRVADHLGIDHHVFNLTEEFDRHVVAAYVEAHASGATPNPCIECNRHVKFGTLLRRAERLGFDAVATGHHARLVPGPRGPRLARGRDSLKDQSYVLAMLGRNQLDRLLLPVGELTKAEVREAARQAGLRTASKPDSQDVCFIRSDVGRGAFLADRVPLHRGDLVDAESGQVVGSVDAVELVTVGQRRGLAGGGGGGRRYAVAVDVPGRRVLVGSAAQAAAGVVAVSSVTVVDGTLPEGGRVLAQTSAHGPARPATVVMADGAGASGVLTFDVAERPAAPGQTVAWYDPQSPDVVVGSAVVVGRACGQAPVHAACGQAGGRAHGGS